MRSTIRFALFAAIALTQSTYAAGPVLSQAQIESAIAEGQRYKTVDKFLEHGLKGNRVKIDGAMARDGISKYCTFFNDWYAAAAESAAANQQMRTIKPEDIQSNGLLHAFVEVNARGDAPISKLNRRYRDQRAHLVLKIGERIIQPTEKIMVKQSDPSPAMTWLGLGTQSGKITLTFAFDVSSDDLKQPVQVILIDGDGNRHQQTADLRGVLEIGE